MRIGSIVQIASYSIAAAKKKSSATTAKTPSSAVSSESSSISDSVLSSLPGGSAAVAQNSASLQMGKTTRALTAVKKRGNDLKTIESNLTRMKELAATAASSKTSDADKINAQVEFNKLKSDTKRIVSRYVEPETSVSKSKDTTYAYLEADSSNGGDNAVADIFKDFSKLGISSENISGKLDSLRASVGTKIELNAAREKKLYSFGAGAIGELKMTLSKNQRKY